ncbi:MAG: diacylglycerol kinase family protein [Ferruginibacter sp.]|nr:diacylglycerol kinase family protein [Ferruginibacter sp.]
MLKTKLAKSFRFAVNGVAYALKSQQNFRIHLVVLAVTLVAGYFFNISRIEWLFVTICAMLVLILELVNTAIEYLCDLVTREIHPAIKIIKDVAAAAVLLAAAGSVVIGIVIFLPKLVALF